MKVQVQAISYFQIVIDHQSIIYNGKNIINVSTMNILSVYKRACHFHNSMADI